MREIPSLTTALAVASSAAAESQFEARLLKVDPNEACKIADFIARPLREIAEFVPACLGNSGKHAYNINGDGWLDLIAGNFVPAEVLWYQSPGKQGLAPGKLWKLQLLASTAPRTRSPACATSTATAGPTWRSVARPAPGCCCRSGPRGRHMLATTPAGAWNVRGLPYGLTGRMAPGPDSLISNGSTRARRRGFGLGS